MTCNFEPANCSPQCKKYSICSYFYLQRQMNEIQGQLNTILKVINILGSKNEELNEKLDIYTKDMLDLISYEKNNRERQEPNEV